MTSHWPTFADGLFWCACDNRTFDTEEAWQTHVVDSVNLENLRRLDENLARIDAYIHDEQTRDIHGDGMTDAEAAAEEEATWD